MPLVWLNAELSEALMSHLACLLFPPGVVYMVLIGKPTLGALLEDYLLLSQKTQPDKKQSKEESSIWVKMARAWPEQEDWLAVHITLTAWKRGVINPTINYVYPFRSGSQSRE